MSTLLEHQFTAFLRTRGPDRYQPGSPSQLHSGCAHAAARTVNQYALAGHGLGFLKQRSVCNSCRYANGRTLLERHV